ncbi:CLUMA_CG011151, isoform A [Clunio marinus]|uniref:CLUMA_CG011151, isoform A n=1 Tax=Clunio marinus TaxID=568069 RepID=A0A1J1IDZ0_9DIPT|nr:CLUMA_CG011151, isoform A [Clunio marinus]
MKNKRHDMDASNSYFKKVRRNCSKKKTLLSMLFYGYCDTKSQRPISLVRPKSRHTPTLRLCSTITETERNKSTESAQKHPNE